MEIENKYNLELLVEEIEKRGQILDIDIEKLSRFTYPSLEKQFVTKIHENELYDFQEKELFNIINLQILFERYSKLIDPIQNLDYKQRKDFEDQCNESSKQYQMSENDMHLMKIRIVVHLNVIDEKTGDVVFTGIIPKTGIFCQRQKIANRWFAGYFSFICAIYIFISKISNYNYDKANFWLKLNLSNYITKNQSLRFKNDKSLNYVDNLLQINAKMFSTFIMMSGRNRTNEKYDFKSLLIKK